MPPMHLAALLLVALSLLLSLLLPKHMQVPFNAVDNFVASQVSNITCN